jgi:NTE family protein
MNKIKHIVISGGGQTFVTFYGILKQANIKEYWNIEDIESIYATSAGSMVGLLIALNCEWEVLDNYLMKRPWQKVFNIDINSILSIFDNYGLLNQNVINEFFAPLFELKEISLDITLKEFYELTKIDFYIYTTEVNSFTSIAFSHKTHPEWKLLDAIYSSSCVPLLFSPLNMENSMYVDGGLLMDFPIQDCLNCCIEDEVLAIKKNTKKPETGNNVKPSFLVFLYSLFKKCVNHALPKYDKQIKNIIYVYQGVVSIEDIINVSASEELRYSMMHEGENIFDEYIKNN